MNVNIYVYIYTRTHNMEKRGACAIQIKKLSSPFDAPASGVDQNKHRTIDKNLSSVFENFGINKNLG